jgi:Rhodopirellula transposase DDE domain
MTAEEIAVIRRKYRLLDPELNERTRRLWAAAEAEAAGRGGVTGVAEATGLSRPRIERGVRELRERAVGARLAAGRIRRPGAGPKRRTDQDPTLLPDLDRLVDPATRGDPMSPLRWTCKSTRNLANALNEQGHKVSAQTVADVLREQGYSLQVNFKTREGSSHPDRNAQFEYINAVAKAFETREQPVISVDTKKKELVGDFKNAGREWQPKGTPEAVQMHDFPDPHVGKAIPYGVYDIKRNEGWVNVGVDHDTPDFAVQGIRAWWKHVGSHRYANASELMINADSGGSNSARSRGWKMALQNFADETGLHITVCHFPPGTSKWNKIEHRMFCHITRNWRGRPLVTHEVIVDLIANTTTQAGLTIGAKLDKRSYPTGIKITKGEFKTINLQPAAFHGEWNYTIAPRAQL